MPNLNSLGALLFFLLLVGFFAGIEAAFSGINRLSVELRKKQGRTGGILISQYLDRPSNFIGVVLIGFNICLVVYGLMIGEFLEPLWHFLEETIPVAYANIIHIFFEIFIATAIFVVFGEFLPRAIWRARNEWLLSSAVASIINFFVQILQPIATVFVSIAEWILKYLFNIRLSEKREAFVRADLDAFYQQITGEKDSDGQDVNTNLFENALSLPNIKVRQCLIPRKEIEGINVTTPINIVVNKFIDTKLSKLVVYEGNIDHILGYVHQLDLFKHPADLKSILLPIPAVPESMNATDLINKFTKERKSMAWVVDEFGGTSGIVTMEDLLEEIFGEIQDEHDTEELEEKKISDTEYILSGRLELDYLHDKYDFIFEQDESETLSGYIIQHHETIPKIKERIIIDDFEFEILAVSDTRIEMVRLKILK
ncbi:hemolysin family protein [Flavihumibacter profundi]|jgi:putative hemolysin|uniref:hemolysin family protein n=1 Tax=Flavihumibacter profundi TaxID=2716883 RepID=UPI001CC3C327|nr:hemolysin family protein [Flavihumibacter profundi]MBZ5857862.1 hemolysin family protein [Flavihumibacter profundi]